MSDMKLPKGMQQAPSLARFAAIRMSRIDNKIDGFTARTIGDRELESNGCAGSCTSCRGGVG